MKTAYANLKTHFDTLILGGRRAFRPTGFESIRDTFETAYKKKVSIFDIYLAKIGAMDTCPIDSIATFVGPDSKIDGFNKGITVDSNSVVFAHAISENSIGKISDTYAKEYFYEVYDAIEKIVSYDKFYGSDKQAQNNLLICVTKALPFYLTFHHIRNVMENGGVAGNADKFADIVDCVCMDILTKYIAGSEEDAKAICESLLDNKFSDDIAEIYAHMTNNGALELFV